MGTLGAGHWQWAIPPHCTSKFQRFWHLQIGRFELVPALRKTYAGGAARGRGLIRTESRQPALRTLVQPYLSFVLEPKAGTRPQGARCPCSTALPGYSTAVARKAKSSPVAEIFSKKNARVFWRRLQMEAAAHTAVLNMRMQLQPTSE